MLIIFTTMTFASLKRAFDGDDSSESSSPESPTMFPVIMTDVNGESKILWSDVAVKEYKQTVELAKSALLVDSGTRQASPVDSGIKRTLSVDATTREKPGIHGLAPTGMLVPRTGNAFRVGGGGSAKQPLKESNQERYLRIREEQEEKKKKTDKRAVKKLKKQGKVGTLAGFMY
jgi:hypothetical protein